MNKVKVKHSLLVMLCIFIHLVLRYKKYYSVKIPAKIGATGLNGKFDIISVLLVDLS